MKFEYIKPLAVDQLHKSTIEAAAEHIKSHFNSFLDMDDERKDEMAIDNEILVKVQS